MLYGKALKWTTAPRPPGKTEAKAFDNFSSARSEGDTDRTMKSVVLNLQEEFVKVRGMEMGQNGGGNQNG